ncbi:hypothetical protein Patl1_32010 [Pistacia atlantica]|uniref:Uncharacterized protein n=1 Tax=Pistacia atlantica TaxID=434234 RepID=A0ACC1APR3_9ROSI|nr:hypothetical protein Patl1_32010 [Pistacia atlantica]
MNSRILKILLGLHGEVLFGLAYCYQEHKVFPYRLVDVLFPALHEAFPSLYLMRLTSNSSRTGGDAQEDDVGVGLWLQGYS